ncbi:conserved hypothetical protein [Candidatus Nitrotoga sp. HW29]|uniref:hypothetical protein n=1 Tax=Candidatus Nitrotoga sp. HW29 TaxID=2886963 RepID=UPI001EF38C24|nr:hypothetical protein [Candidatus Nitrotoga sp. HW29]CAH1904588.1 conserved hypothetical protein [Candidatus Nitrotoga sp. HW29]
MRSPKFASIKHLISRIPEDERLGTQLWKFMQRIEKDAFVVTELRENPDAMKTTLAISQDIVTAQNNLKATIDTVRDLLRSSIIQFRENMEAEQLKSSNFVPNEYAAEIRLIYRSLDDAGKAKMLTDAFTQHDGATAAALIGVPAVLTGMSPDRIALLRQQFLDQVAPVKDVDFINKFSDTSEEILRIASEIAIEPV